MCTTFIGISIDFDTDVVERITSNIYGANYFTVISMKEFDLMISPLICNLK